MRRLDPWAALLLGGLLAMGVVILLATPGPWQRVVGKQPPVQPGGAGSRRRGRVRDGRPRRRPAAGSCGCTSTPRGTRSRPSSSRRRVSGFSPTDGYAPISAIADSAGPGTAAAALGGSAGREHGRLGGARPPGVGPGDPGDVARERAVQAARTPLSGGALGLAWPWRRQRPPGPTQYAELARRPAPGAVPTNSGRGAFSNYVLGFGFVRSDLTLQGATSLAEALRDVDPAGVEVRAAPVIMERSSRRGGVARGRQPDGAAVASPWRWASCRPRPTSSSRVRKRAARVLVVAPFAAPARRQQYAAQVRRRSGAFGRARPIR